MIMWRIAVLIDFIGSCEYYKRQEESVISSKTEMPQAVACSSNYLR